MNLGEKTYPITIKPEMDFRAVMAVSVGDKSCGGKKTIIITRSTTHIALKTVNSPTGVPSLLSLESRITIQRVH